MIRVRRIESDEAEVYRAVRLAALEESPAAFATTLDAATGFESDVWEERVRTASVGIHSVIFLAFDDQESPIGMVAVLEGDPERTTAELVSMWVAPSGRRQGVGASLVERAVSWAAESGFGRVELWVTEGNHAAEALYRKLGFVVTGDVKPLPSDPCKDEVRMRLVVGAAGATRSSDS